MVIERVFFIRLSKLYLFIWCGVILTNYFIAVNIAYNETLLILFAIAFWTNYLWTNDINASIDTSNYYNYLKKGYSILKGDKLTTSRLSINDIVPFVLEELTKTGYDWHYEKCLFKVDSGKYAVLAEYSRKSNFVFIYIEEHNMFPSFAYRKNMTESEYMGVDYVSCEETKQATQTL
jgi:hypothetical protein